MRDASPIFCALDTASRAEAMRLASAVAPHVGGLKIGLEAYSALGPALVEEIRSLGLPIFLDLKLHDIPNTVARALQALAPLEPSYVTVHAAGGPAMLKAATEAADKAGICILAVTVLTSLDGADLASIGVARGPEDQVDALAALALEAGAGGLVCSPSEVARLRARFGAGPRLVVPGIRPAGSAPGDQKRIATPGEALAAGADILVIGRPITAAEDPGAAAGRLAREALAA